MEKPDAQYVSIYDLVDISQNAVLVKVREMLASDRLAFTDTGEPEADAVAEYIGTLMERLKRSDG